MPGEAIFLFLSDEKRRKKNKWKDKEKKIKERRIERKEGVERKIIKMKILLEESRSKIKIKRS